MGWLKFGLIACGFWGMAVFADRTEAVGGASQELQTIQSWMTYINTNYEPTANVATFDDLSDAGARQQVQQELYILESVFRGEAQAPKKSLLHLVCGNAVCGGGDPGGCVKCD